MQTVTLVLALCSRLGSSTTSFTRCGRRGPTWSTRMLPRSWTRWKTTAIGTTPRSPSPHQPPSARQMTPRRTLLAALTSSLTLRRRRKGKVLVITRAPRANSLPPTLVVPAVAAAQPVRLPRPKSLLPQSNRIPGRRNETGVLTPQCE